MVSNSPLAFGCSSAAIALSRGCYATRGWRGAAGFLSGLQGV